MAKLEQKQRLLLSQYNSDRSSNRNSNGRSNSVNIWAPQQISFPQPIGIAIRIGIQSRNGFELESDWNWGSRVRTQVPIWLPQPIRDSSLLTFARSHAEVFPLLTFATFLCVSLLRKTARYREKGFSRLPSFTSAFKYANEKTLFKTTGSDFSCPYLSFSLSDNSRPQKKRSEHPIRPLILTSLISNRYRDHFADYFLRIQTSDESKLVAVKSGNLRHFDILQTARKSAFFCSVIVLVVLSK